MGNSAYQIGCSDYVFGRTLNPFPLLTQEFIDWEQGFLVTRSFTMDDFSVSISRVNYPEPPQLNLFEDHHV